MLLTRLLPAIRLHMCVEITKYPRGRKREASNLRICYPSCCSSEYPHGNDVIGIVMTVHISIGHEHPDCLFRDRESLVVPGDILPHRIESISATATHLRRHIHREMVSADDFVFGPLDRMSEASGTITPQWEEHDDGSSLANFAEEGVEGTEPSETRSLHAPADDLKHTIIPEESDNLDGVAATTTTPEPIETTRPYTPHTPSQHRRASVASHHMPPTHNYVHVRPMPHPNTDTSFLRSRLLLSHLGHMSFDGVKDGCFYLLGKSPAFYRDIKVLDRKHG